MRTILFRTALFALVAGVLAMPIRAQAVLSDIPDPIRSGAPAPEIEAPNWMLANFDTGWILAGEGIDERIEPASLTKLMTSFMVFSGLRDGEIAMEDEVLISKKAWRTGGSKMFIQVDSRVRIIDLLQGLIVQSGNDAAVALAEHLGGTEEGFAARMNLTAAELGMTNSNFTNASGLPDENHYSTVRDLITLSRALIAQFPELFKYYSQLEYTYNDITQGNRNILLTRDPTVDGLKTGYTRNAGYALIGTARRDGIRMIAMVTGSESKTKRANEVQSLLQFGYAAYEGLVVYEVGDEVKSIPLWMGEEPSASIGVGKSLGIIYPKGEKDNLSAALELPDSLEAPVSGGAQVGHIQVKFNGEPVYRSTLHVNRDYPEGPWYYRLLDSVKQMIF